MIYIYIYIYTFIHIHRATGVIQVFCGLGDKNICTYAEACTYMSSIHTCEDIEHSHSLLSLSLSMCVYVCMCGCMGVYGGWVLQINYLPAAPDTCV